MMIDNFDQFSDEYDDISLDEYEQSDKTRALAQKFQDKVDFNMKTRETTRDKSDRATTDHALDRRSCAILYKLMSQGVFHEVNGCISTGKEANVYHAVGQDGDIAIKLYMTSILPFKSRSKYVEGDFRMRRGYSTCSSWKLVTKWAEKEYRNLLRINMAHTIAAPVPMKLKGVVLLMTLIGKDGVPAPKLKDVASGDWSEFGPPPDWALLYKQILMDVRTLFQKCRLVHADLSEYNLLYMDGKAWMIDVSQAVEHEAPQALDFLRNDCYNVNAFFRRQGADTLTLREFFEWVVDPSLPDVDNARLSGACIDTFLEQAAQRGHNQTLQAEDDAFRRVYVPRNLFEVKQFFRDFMRLKHGLIKPEDLYYTAVTGVRSELPGGQRHVELKSEEEAEINSEEETAEGPGGESDVKPKFESSRRPRNETPESKRNRKKAVHEAKAEKRTHKLPKDVKKRAIKGKS